MSNTDAITRTGSLVDLITSLAYLHGADCFELMYRQPVPEPPVGVILEQTKPDARGSQRYRERPVTSLPPPAQRTVQRMCELLAAHSAGPDFWVTYKCCPPRVPAGAVRVISVTRGQLVLTTKAVTALVREDVLALTQVLDLGDRAFIDGLPLMKRHIHSVRAKPTGGGLYHAWDPA